MVLTKARPESWMRATRAVSRCSDRCQGASAGEGTNYRTAAQQTLTPALGTAGLSRSPCPLSLDPRPGTVVANSSRSPSREAGSGASGELWWIAPTYYLGSYKDNLLPETRPLTSKSFSK